MSTEATLAVAKSMVGTDIKEIALALARRGYDAEVIWRAMNELAREAAVFAIVWAAHEDARQENLSIAVAHAEELAGRDLAQAAREAGAA